MTTMLTREDQFALQSRLSRDEQNTSREASDHRADSHYDRRYENSHARRYNDQYAPVASMRDEHERRYDAGLDQVRYWVGAGLTAAIAALAALVGITVLTGVFHIGLDGVHSTVYGLAAAGIALGAATLYYGMLHVAPRPAVYYSWLAIVTTLLAAVIPFATPAALNAQIALAGLNVVVGLIITGLVPVAAVQARR